MVHPGFAKESEERPAMRLRDLLYPLRGLVLVAALSGCSMFGDDKSDGPGLLFGGDDEVVVQREPAPVQALRKIEIGRTRDGYSVTAFGTAPTTGYGAASLRARRAGAPADDGYLDFDFVAVPPDPALNMPQGTIDARAIRADARLTVRQTAEIRGLRIHTITNSGQVDF